MINIIGNVHRTRIVHSGEDNVLLVSSVVDEYCFHF